MLNYAISRSSPVNIWAYLLSPVSLFDQAFPTFCACDIEPWKQKLLSQILSNIRTSVAGIVVVVADLDFLPASEALHPPCLWISQRSQDTVFALHTYGCNSLLNKSNCRVSCFDSDDL